MEMWQAGYYLFVFMIWTLLILNYVNRYLGGVLRSVDFIYKSAGVNRPLRSKEEKPQDNLNNTLYRDQINKVANSIKEIIQGLSSEPAMEVEEKIQAKESFKEVKADEIMEVKERPAKAVNIKVSIP